MSHSVVIAKEAKDNITAISSYIAQDSPSNALRWRQRIRERIRSLQNFPARHEIAYRAETSDSKCGMRYFGVYRILYVVEVERVVVISVRHGARRPLTHDEVRRLNP